MLSINTNLQSLIVQNNLTKSTTGLNQAIERMTTGYKINHASDNAAGYSIAQNMTSKLNSYEVARDNISAGLDLLATTQDTISLMQSHGQRIHALITQAQNGTYGAQSLDAINSEIGARIAEINRLYMNTEYNGIDVLNGIKLPDWTQEVKANAGTRSANAPDGFMDEIATVTPDVVVTEAADLEDAINDNEIIGIANAEVLAELATLVNDGTQSCEDKTIILTDDIDLSTYQSGTGWTAIGTSDDYFRGTFDGQGHKVKNLKIDTTADDQGLFGDAEGEIKNVGIENCDVKGGQGTGGLVGCADGAIITNCYATGTVTGSGYNTGGLVGYATGAITNCYATGSVTGGGMWTGGLAGYAYDTIITNCYATGSVTGSDDYTGGLAGCADGAITNCYATGSVTGAGWTGGLAGYAYDTITNCYSTGSVTGAGWTGGLAGGADGAIINCYATGSVTGSDDCTGGLAGLANGAITNCYATGNVNGSQGGTLYDNSGNTESIEIQDITLQVGVDGGESSQITFNSGISYDLSSILSMGAQDSGCYNVINTFLDDLSRKATELGAVSNRLESALDSTGVAIENLTSSRSTLRDADVAKESSAYIKYQILQQAAATLLATANQTPSIALQLL